MQSNTKTEKHKDRIKAEYERAEGRRLRGGWACIKKFTAEPQRAQRKRRGGMSRECGENR